MTTGQIIGIIVAVAVILVLIYIFTTYNSLVKLKNKVEEAFSTMDVYLKKRWDLIPNIVSTVKGYAKHEAETLENVIKARNSNYQNMSEEEKIEANASISKSIPNFSVLAEQYPDLKANQNFLDLSSQLKSVENDIANARKYYNAVVRQYNNKIEMFPSNIVANMFKYSKKTMFAVDDTNQRQNVKVEFWWKELNIL